MADLADRAQEVEALTAQRAVAHVQAQTQMKGVQDCIECGEMISKNRRLAMPSARRCIDCQEQAEN